MRLRNATTDDLDFIVEMARHACVIEDWRLPDAESEDTRSLLPGSGDTAIVAAVAGGSGWAQCGCFGTIRRSW
jgi:hypothetical protein